MGSKFLTRTVRRRHVSPGVTIQTSAAQDSAARCTVRNTHQDGFREVVTVDACAQERLDDLVF